jgi:4-amino-4-deoxy-L-arabinose transferase-like glycosyltransferase
VTSATIRHSAGRATPSQFTWSILAAGALLRVVSFFLSDNNGTDALARASMTANLIAHPSFRLVFTDWLPLHFWLMAGLALLIGHVELACRLLSLLTGIASLWLFWKIVQHLYSETAANLSLLVFALYSLHIAYSTTSSSEAPFLFFVLGGVLCFLLYQSSGHLRWIALSGISLTLSGAIRYEGWILIFGVGLILFASTVAGISHRLEKSRLLVGALGVFCLAGGFWPVFWMSYSWLKWKNPLYIVALNHVNVANTFANNPSSSLYRLMAYPGALFLTLSPLGFAGALYALRLSLRETVDRSVAFLVVLLALVQLYQVSSGGVMPFARYTMTLGTLMAIMSGQGLVGLRDLCFPRSARLFVNSVAAILALNLGAIWVMGSVPWRFAEKFASISPVIKFTGDLKDASISLRHHMSSADAVVIDNYNVQSNLVQAAAGLPLVTDRVFSVSAEQPQNLRSDLYAFFRAKHPKYLVYSDQGTLRPYLGLPAGCPSKPILRDHMQFRCFYANRTYSLYEITY